MLRPAAAFDVRRAGPAIILFDGDCALCSRLVNFVVRHNPRAYFRFAPLRSAEGQALLARYRVPRELDTVVLIEAGAAFTRSTAALRIARRLAWPWDLLSSLMIIPAFIRDPLYAALARQRHRWLRPKQCPLAAPDVAARVLTQSPNSNEAADQR